MYEYNYIYIFYIFYKKEEKIIWIIEFKKLFLRFLIQFLINSFVKITSVSDLAVKILVVIYI